MDIYHIWCNLRGGVSDAAFSANLDRYLGDLKGQGAIEAYRLTRRKLGFGPPALGEFHLMIEVRDLAQLDQAFRVAATRAGVVEGLHQAVNSLVTDFTAALYRDFPDAVRKFGEEKF